MISTAKSTKFSMPLSNTPLTVLWNIVSTTFLSNEVSHAIVSESPVSQKAQSIAPEISFTFWPEIRLTSTLSFFFRSSSIALSTCLSSNFFAILYAKFPALYASSRGSIQSCPVANEAIANAPSRKAPHVIAFPISLSDFPR